MALETNKDIAIRNFDDVVTRLGQFGRYQRTQYFLLCLPGIICGFHQLAGVLLADTPDFRCELPASVYNAVDTYQIQNEYHRKLVCEYIPSDKESNDTKCEGEYKTCQFINNNESCSHYVFSDKYMVSTVVTQWNLVCDEVWKSTTSTSVYMAGVLVGAFVFGILSDGIGRKKTLLICIFLQGTFGLSGGFAPEFYSFIVLRFLVGAASMGLFMTAFVLGLELVGPKYRMFCGIVIEYFFALGYVLLTGIGYGFKKWKLIQITISSPSFILLVYYWFINESPRWLLSKGRTKEAENVILKAAKVNGVQLPDELLSSIQDGVMTERIATIFTSAPRLLGRTLVIFFNWMVIAMSYYGLSLNGRLLGGNIFINFMLGGLVEFPAYTVCFLCNKLGRKWPHVTGMMIGGLACLGMMLVDLYLKDDPNVSTYLIILNMVGKFGMTIAFCIIYFWSAELYPTTIRNSMMGFSSTLARVGSIAAPYIVDLGKYIDPKYKNLLPAVIFGSLVIVGGLMSIILPETANTTLPETIEEANNFPNHRMQTTTESKADLIDTTTKF